MAAILPRQPFRTLSMWACQRRWLSTVTPRYLTDVCFFNTIVSIFTWTWSSWWLFGDHTAPLVESCQHWSLIHCIQASHRCALDLPPAGHQLWRDLYYSHRWRCRQHGDWLYIQCWTTAGRLLTKIRNRRGPKMILVEFNTHVLFHLQQ